VNRRNTGAVTTGFLLPRVRTIRDVRLHSVRIAYLAVALTRSPLQKEMTLKTALKKTFFQSHALPPSKFYSNPDFYASNGHETVQCA